MKVLDSLHFVAFYTTYWANTGIGRPVRQQSKLHKQHRLVAQRICVIGGLPPHGIAVPDTLNEEGQLNELPDKVG